MKKPLILLFLSISIVINATNYYVSSSGNDANDGYTTATAWKTITKVNTVWAAGTFIPGDNILFKRGDTFYGTLISGESGTNGNPITVGAYSTGANPVIDANNTLGNCITLSGRSYITIDGIDCKNAVSYGIASPSSPGNNIIIKNLTISDIGTTNADLQHGIYQQGGYLTVDNCIITRISHCGIMFGGSHNTITNNNISYTNLYYTGWGAGINGTSSFDEIAYNTLDYCGGVGEATKTHSIYVVLTNGNVHHNTITHSTKGSGIKSNGGGDFHHNYISGSYLGGISTGFNTTNTVTTRIYSNIFTGNRQAISESSQGSGAFTLQIYNNTCYYNNSTQEDNYYSEITLDDNINTSLVINNNILFGSGRYTFAFNTAQSHAVINNNCVYQTTGNLIYYNGSARTWAYWQSLGFDAQGINSNPNLVNPITDFHLQTNSPAINTGVNVGLPFSGSAPDLGAFESQGTSAAVNPVYSGSTVENTTPSVIGMNYNLTLASTLPPASAFSVMVNSVARTVNTIAVSGTKVLLTLASPAVKGDVITVAYTVPATNPLQSTSGGPAATMSAQAVTNNVIAAVAIPVYVSSVLQNATPGSLEITYSLSQANIVPAATAFKVLVNNASRTVNTVAVSGTKVILTLASPVIFGDVATVAYTKPATNPLQTVSGTQVESFSAQSVVNGVIAVTNPVVATVKMTVSPNPVHKIINVGLDYTGSTSAQITALSPQNIKIYDNYGRLYINKSLVTGTTSCQIGINLRSGVYNVQMLSAGAVKALQKIIVYR